MARRLAIGLATLGLVLCIGGAVLSARVIVGNAGRLDGFYLWTILPLSLATVVLVQVLRAGGPWTVWAAVGALWGFVIAAMWSLGLFYFHGAVVLLAAAVTYLIAMRAWRKVLLACGWLIAGMSSLGPTFLILGRVRELLDPTLTVGTAEALVYFSWLFLATLGGLGVWELTQRSRLRYRP